jgi:hypothetical protein
MRLRLPRPRPFIRPTSLAFTYARLIRGRAPPRLRPFRWLTACALTRLPMQA